MNPRYRTALWVLFNLVGMAIYLYHNQLRVYPDEAGMPSQTGNAILWWLYQAPVLLLYIVANLAALVAALMRFRRNRRPSELYLWLAMIALWVVVAIYGHHDRLGYSGSSLATTPVPRAAELTR